MSALQINVGEKKNCAGTKMLRAVVKLGTSRQPNNEFVGLHLTHFPSYYNQTTSLSKQIQLKYTAVTDVFLLKSGMGSYLFIYFLSEEAMKRKIK